MCKDRDQFKAFNIRDNHTKNHIASERHRVAIALPSLNSLRAQQRTPSFALFAFGKSPATPGKSPAKPVGIPARVPAQKPAHGPVGIPVGKPTGMPLGMASGRCLEVRP